MPFINEAAYALMEGVAEAEAIDTIARLGFAHPIGPLALADLIGLDTCVAIMEVLERGLGDAKYAPCPLLARARGRRTAGPQERPRLLRVRVVATAALPSWRGSAPARLPARRRALRRGVRRRRLRLRASARARRRGARACAREARGGDAVAGDAAARARHERGVRARSGCWTTPSRSPAAPASAASGRGGWKGHPARTSA